MSSRRTFFAGGHTGFSAFRTGGSTLHAAGTASLPWPEVQALLERGTFPDALRGNFAFVWEGPDDTIAAVDHLATIPLFYSDAQVSPIFHTLRATIASPEADRECPLEMQILLGHTVGTRTTCAQIARVEPGHYLARGAQHRFIDLAAIETDEQAEPGPLAEIVERAVLDRMAPGAENALLLSAGTDSTTLAGITRKLGVEERFDYLHLYSDRQWVTEARTALKVAQEMQLPLRMIKVRTSLDELPGDPARLRAFWIDSYVGSKILGVCQAGHERSTVFTGELGDQLYGGPKTELLLHHVLNRGRADAREIAAVWLNQSHSWNRLSGTRPTPWLEQRFAEEPRFREVYERLLDHIASVFRSASTRDLVNRLLLVNLIVKGPVRAYPYSQDTIRWVHPFTDWHVVEASLRLPSRHKIKGGGVLKAIYQTLWGTWVSPIPFRNAKTGMQIPMQSKLVKPVDP
ncbi:MAG: asparagine synthase-related protein [Byssovorax sp.]